MAEPPDPVLTATEHPPPPEALERSIEPVPDDSGAATPTGFTGTLLWLDPDTGRFAVVLTNRVLTGEKTSVTRLRKEVLAALNARALHGQ